MKYIVLLFVAISLLDCSSPKSEYQASDSLAVQSDSLPIAADTIEVPSTEDYAEDTASLDLQQRMEETLDEFKSRKDSYLSINISMSGYEYKSDIVWYFDSLFTLTGYYEDWALEGTSGTRYVLFDNGKPIAVKEEDYQGDSRSLLIKLEDIPGKIFSDENGETNITDLQEAYLETKHEELKRQLSETLGLIAGEEVDHESESITIHLERNSDIGGQNITETSDYTLEKILYKNLDKLNPGL